MQIKLIWRCITLRSRRLEGQMEAEVWSVSFSFAFDWFWEMSRCLNSTLSNSRFRHKIHSLISKIHTLVVCPQTWMTLIIFCERFLNHRETGLEFFGTTCWSPNLNFTPFAALFRRPGGFSTKPHLHICLSQPGARISLHTHWLTERVLISAGPVLLPPRWL